MASSLATPAEAAPVEPEAASSAKFFFEFQRKAFILLSPLSAALSILLVIFFYDFDKNLFWACATLVLSLLGFISQMGWSFWFIKHDHELELKDKHLKGKQLKGKLKVALTGHFILLNAMKNQRTKFNTIYMNLVAMNVFMHWMPNLILQIYILFSTTYSHGIHLLSIIVNFFCVVLFVGFLVQRHFNIKFRFIFLWLFFKLIFLVIPAAMFTSLETDRFQEWGKPYKIFGFAWSFFSAINIMLYVMAEKYSRMFKSHQGMSPVKKIIIAISVVVFVVNCSQVYKWQSKFEVNPPPQTNTKCKTNPDPPRFCGSTHENVSDFVLALKNGANGTGCKEIPVYMNCLGTNLLKDKICPKWPSFFTALWFETSLRVWTPRMRTAWTAVVIVGTFFTSEFLWYFLARHFPNACGAIRPSSRRLTKPPESFEEYLPLAKITPTMKALSDFFSPINRKIRFRKDDDITVLTSEGRFWTVKIGKQEPFAEGRVHRGFFMPDANFQFSKLRAINGLDLEAGGTRQEAAGLLYSKGDIFYQYEIRPEQPGFLWGCMNTEEKFGWVEEDNFERKLK